MRRVLVGVVVLAGLLGGCAKRQDAPPLLAISVTECPAKPVYAQARPLAFNGKDEVSQEVEISGTSSCFQDGEGQKRLYVLFQLPDSPVSYTVTVASAVQGGSIFAPNLTLLDAAGATVRDIGSDKLMFRSGMLTGLFLPHPGERYLLVSSNPEAVGHSFTRTTETVNSRVFPVGTGYMNVYSGSDNTVNLVYSHAGKVTVTVEPSRK